MKLFPTLLTTGLGAGLLLAFTTGPALIEAALNRTVSKKGQRPVSREAHEVHHSAFVADMHADSLLWGRDLLLRGSRGHVDLPRLIEGGVGLQAFTIVSTIPFPISFETNRTQAPDLILPLGVMQRWPTRAWRSPLERALLQTTRLRELEARANGQFRVITCREDLETYLHQYEQNRHQSAGILGLEGAQPLEGRLENLDRLFAAGVRMLSPSHFTDTRMGGSAHGERKGGLTDFGREVIQKMGALGMVLDLAHASEATFREALEISARPALVSHTGVRGICNKTRNLSDDQLRAIARSGGLVGIAFFKTALGETTPEAIVRSIRYVSDLVGADHVGLGSDFDGAVATPFDATGLEQITQLLLQEGFSLPEIRKILGGNFLRVLREALPKIN